jgi:hypothetical protein
LGDKEGFQKGKILMIPRLAMCFTGVVLGVAAQDQILCLPSSPSAQAGSSVTLSVLYRPPDGAKAVFKWSVSTGAIRDEKGVTVWDLKQARPGLANADVDAAVNGVKAASCSVELRVEGETPESRTTPSPAPPPPPPPARPAAPPTAAARPPNGGGVALSGRGFLAPRQVEPDGYGLYSYVLVSAPPAPADRDRYVAIFDAVERLLRPVSDLAQSFKPAQLNATWLPVKSLPSSDADGRWLVDNYDYTAATVDLARANIHGDTPGIYIVSMRTPLSRGNAAPPFLVQNLSHVPATLASTWVTLFINQAAQERFWNTNTMDQLLAKMRLAISLTAEGVPEVKSAVATLISVSK